MKRSREQRVAFALANVAAVLIEVALTVMLIATVAVNVGMMTTLLAAGIVACMAVVVAMHARLIVRRRHSTPQVSTIADTSSDLADTQTTITLTDAETGDDSVADTGEAPVASFSETPALASETAGDGEPVLRDMLIADERPVADPPVPVAGTSLDVEELFERLTATSDPIGELRLIVGDIRRREGDAAAARPSPFERFAARMLEESGVCADDIELGALRIVRPAASGMFYLRIDADQLPYLAKVRVLTIEAALNAVRLSATYFDEPNDHDVDEHYRLAQNLARSICAQSPNLAEGVPVIDDEHPDSEWAVRLGISTAIESLQLPYRLVANWRVNVADGNVAIELELTPDAAFPATSYVDSVGLVASTRDMRRRAAGDYALRLALLVAACAFRCSARIQHVWVAGISETATRHDCLLSVDFDRGRFFQLDLADLGDLREVYHRFVPQLRYDDAILRPVRQTFALSEPRFCPPRRYESVDLSNRRLGSDTASSLGTDHVSGLAINEGDKRRLIAFDIMRNLTDSTEGNVRAILELAADDPDLSVRAAAERTVRKLIDGTLSDEPLAIGEEFVSGDALSRAVAEAQLAFQSRDLPGAVRRLEAALHPLDDAGIYTDSHNVEWRYFPSYVNRAMYNRLCATEGRTLMLVPDAYFEAHLLLSAALLGMGRGEEALVHAHRLVELSPLDTRARLHTTRCLELLGRPDEAIAMLADLLVTAHDPHSLGIGYYRMAFFQWQKGRILAAQACYQRALSFAPDAIPLIAMELTALAMQNPGSVHEFLSADEAREVLQSSGVPLAPTEQVSKTFFDAARASLDAEVFPVARNFVNILGAFSGDDILMGLIRSIEDEPGL